MFKQTNTYNHIQQFQYEYSMSKGAWSSSWSNPTEGLHLSLVHLSLQKWKLEPFLFPAKVHTGAVPANKGIWIASSRWHKPRYYITLIQPDMQFIVSMVQCIENIVIISFCLAISLDIFKNMRDHGSDVYLGMSLVEFLCASSTWHRTSTDPSHTWGHAEVSEPLGTQRWWHSNSYSVHNMQSLISQCINIPQCRRFVTGPYRHASRLVELTAFSRTAERFSTSYIHSTSKLNPA